MCVYIYIYVLYTSNRQAYNEWCSPYGSRGMIWGKLCAFRKVVFGSIGFFSHPLVWLHLNMLGRVPALHGVIPCMPSLADVCWSVHLDGEVQQAPQVPQVPQIAMSPSTFPQALWGRGERWGLFDSNWGLKQQTICTIMELGLGWVLSSVVCGFQVWLKFHRNHGRVVFWWIRELFGKRKDSACFTPPIFQCHSVLTQRPDIDTAF